MTPVAGLAVLAVLAVALGVAGFLVVALTVLRSRSEIAALLQLQPGPLESPLLVVIPARNEAAGIGACLRRVLADRSPHLRVMVVDDRSSDDTARIVSALAAADPRLTLLTLEDDPPPGTFGKPRALARAVERARAPVREPILFLDADVLLEPGALGALVRAHGEHAAGGALSGVPRLIHGSALEELVMPTLVGVIVGRFGPRAVHAGKAAFLNGQCIVVDAEVFHAVGGFPQDTVLEDVALARLLHGKGAPLRLADLRPFASTRMYSSWRGIVDGFGKNAVALMGLRGAWTTALLALAIALLPWTAVAMAALVDTRALVIALVVLALTMAAQLSARILTRGPKWPVLVLPLAYLATAFVLVRASWRAWRRQPVTWKGREYPT